MLSYAALGPVPGCHLVRLGFTVASAQGADREAVLGTMGVFFGMLVVYKTGPSGHPKF